jgi:hypothetical protein
MRINVKQVLKKAEEDKLKPRPAVKVRLKTASVEIPIPDVVVEHQEIPVGLSSSKLMLVHELEREYSTIKKQRNMMSSQIAKKVAANATQDELKDLYNQIESYRPSLQEYYEKIAYVKIHGALPAVKENALQDDTLYSLRDQKRSLINRRSKLHVNMKKAEATNPSKLTAMQLQLDQLDAEYNDVELKIKKLEGKA